MAGRAATMREQVIADGVLVASFGLVVDEASLTGESEPMHKGEGDPWCRSGTQVLANCCSLLGPPSQAVIAGHIHCICATLHSSCCMPCGSHGKHRDS